ncbi:WxcM-like domain-containing protein [Algoriphagus kandeliae]|uniref:WxcM-like domain-containing protein n=1 Tax=Algoriphagus kandeliae TaxID=2562278 RepID=A0A4Y9QXP3_9BACT|nr:FdtA/QdtA family cupin domain-containing protein [Algoriphagus kandeliae]TFV97234.1 WxcM-like domain-containing protein [Algoriphagus kandeliae]
MKDFNYSRIEDCKLISFDKNHRIKGNITAVNSGEEIPFEIKRVYYLYDIPGGEARGGHAHKNLKQLIIAGSGSFELILDDGFNSKKIRLSQPYEGILIPPGIWRELTSFSSGSICLVLASEIYLEEDYIRDYENFKNKKRKNSSNS